MSQLSSLMEEDDVLEALKEGSPFVLAKGGLLYDRGGTAHNLQVCWLKLHPSEELIQLGYIPPLEWDEDDSSVVTMNKTILVKNIRRVVPSVNREANFHSLLIQTANETDFELISGSQSDFEHWLEGLMLLISRSRSVVPMHAPDAHRGADLTPTCSLELSTAGQQLEVAEQQSALDDPAGKAACAQVLCQETGEAIKDAFSAEQALLSGRLRRSWGGANGTQHGGPKSRGDPWILEELQRTSTIVRRVVDHAEEAQGQNLSLKVSHGDVNNKPKRLSRKICPISRTCSSAPPVRLPSCRCQNRCRRAQYTSHGCHSCSNEATEDFQNRSSVAHSEIDSQDAVADTTTHARRSEPGYSHEVGSEDSHDNVPACDCIGLHLREEDVVSIVREVATRVIKQRCFRGRRAFLCRNHELHCRSPETADTGTCCSSERSQSPTSCSAGAPSQEDGSGRSSTQIHSRQNRHSGFRHRRGSGPDDVGDSQTSTSERWRRGTVAQLNPKEGSVPSPEDNLRNRHNPPRCDSASPQSDRSCVRPPSQTEGGSSKRQHSTEDGIRPNRISRRLPSMLCTGQPSARDSRYLTRQQSEQLSPPSSHGQSRRPSQQQGLRRPNGNSHQSSAHCREQHSSLNSWQPSTQQSRSSSRQSSAQPSRQDSLQPSCSRQPTRLHSRLHSPTESGQQNRQYSCQQSLLLTPEPYQAQTRHSSRQHGQLRTEGESRRPSEKHSRETSLQPCAHNTRTDSRKSSRLLSQQCRLQSSDGISRQPSGSHSPHGNANRSLRPSPQSSRERGRQPRRQHSYRRTHRHSRQSSRLHSPQVSGQPSRHPSRSKSPSSSPQPSRQHRQRSSPESSRQPSRLHSREASGGNGQHASRQQSRQAAPHRSRDHSRRPSPQRSRHGRSGDSKHPSLHHSGEPIGTGREETGRQVIRRHYKDGSQSCSRQHSRHSDTQRSRHTSRQPSRQRSRGPGRQSRRPFGELVRQPSMSHSTQCSRDRCPDTNATKVEQNKNPSQQGQISALQGMSGSQAPGESNRQRSRQYGASSVIPDKHEVSEHASRTNTLHGSRPGSRRHSRQDCPSRGNSLGPSRQHQGGGSGALRARTNMQQKSQEISALLWSHDNLPVIRLPVGSAAVGGVDGEQSGENLPTKSIQSQMLSPLSSRATRWQGGGGRRPDQSQDKENHRRTPQQVLSLSSEKQGASVPTKDDDHGIYDSHSASRSESVQPTALGSRHRIIEPNKQDQQQCSTTAYDHQQRSGYHSRSRSMQYVTQQSSRDREKTGQHSSQDRRLDNRQPSKHHSRPSNRQHSWDRGPHKHDSRQLTARPSREHRGHRSRQGSREVGRQHSRQTSRRGSRQSRRQHSCQPSRQRSRQLSRQHSRQPSRQHSGQSSRQHRRQPSRQHSRQSSRQHSRQSSRQHSRQSSRRHSRQPSRQHSRQPSRQHSRQPSRQHSRQPRSQHSRQPSRQHSRQPSRQHSGRQSRQHNGRTSRQHSRQPSSQQSRQPSRQHNRQRIRQHSRQPSRQHSGKLITQHGRPSSRQHSWQASRQHSREVGSQHSRQSSRQRSRQPRGVHSGRSVSRERNERTCGWPDSHHSRDNSRRACTESSRRQSKQPETCEHSGQQVTEQNQVRPSNEVVPGTQLHAPGSWYRKGPNGEETSANQGQPLQAGGIDRANHGNTLQLANANLRSLNHSKDSLELYRRSRGASSIREEPAEQPEAAAPGSLAGQRGLDIQLGAEYVSYRQGSQQRGFLREARTPQQSRPLSDSPSRSRSPAERESSGAVHPDQNRERRQVGHNQARLTVKRQTRGTRLAPPRNTLPLSRQNTYNGLVTPVEEEDNDTDGNSASSPSQSLLLPQQIQGQPGRALRLEVTAPASEVQSKRRQQEEQQQQQSCYASEKKPWSVVSPKGDSHHPQESQSESWNPPRPRLYYSSSQYGGSWSIKDTGSSSSADFPSPDIDWETPEKRRSRLGSRLPSKSQNAAPDPYYFAMQLQSGQFSRLPSRVPPSIGASGRQESEAAQVEGRSRKDVRNREEDGWSQFLQETRRALVSSARGEGSPRSDNHLRPSAMSKNANRRSSRREGSMRSMQASRNCASGGANMRSVDYVASPLTRAVSSYCVSTSRDPHGKSPDRTESRRPQSNGKQPRQQSPGHARPESSPPARKHSRQRSGLPSSQRSIQPSPRSSRQPSAQGSRQYTPQHSRGQHRGTWSWQRSVEPSARHPPQSETQEREASSWDDEEATETPRTVRAYHLMPSVFSHSVLHRGYYEESYMQGQPLNVMQMARYMKHSASAPPVDAASADAASPYFKLQMRQQSGGAASVASLNEDEQDMVHEIAEYVIRFLKKKQNKYFNARR